MRRAARIALGFVAALVVFGALYPLSMQLCTYVHFGCYWLANAVGLLPVNQVGAMQILGVYFQGPPGWLRQSVEVLTGLTAFAPAAGLGLLTYQLVALGSGQSRVTRCGRCGEALKGLREPRCPHCGLVL